MATTTANPFDPNALANGTSTLTMRTSALNQSEDLVQAGVVFNDATRLLDGGLWNTPADKNNQAAYLGLYTTDLHAVSGDIAAILADQGAATLGGNPYHLTSTDVSTLMSVNNNIQSLLAYAPLSIGNSPAEIQAQQTVHALHTEILSEVANDPTLAAALDNVQYASGTGANNVGFEALPAGADDPATLAAAQAPGATLATVGQVFNAANDLAVGGLNSTNLAEFHNDMQVVATGLTNILNNPTELAQIEAGEDGGAAALTTLHLDTVLNQVNDQINKFDPLYATDPNVAARSTNDNTLDMIDIIQNDTALNQGAGGNGNPGTVGGFSEMPAYLNGAGGVDAHGGTILQYQDDQPQTNFWATFLSEANTINVQLQAVAAGQDSVTQIQQLINQIQNYQNFGSNFDAAQGGVFGARFDNELLSGTLLADTTNAVHGLTGIANGDTEANLTADQAQILAAGSGFVADANDVSGNNIPIGGGTFIGTATTVATATSPNGVAMGSIPVTANPDIANGVGAAGEVPTTGGAPATGGDPATGGPTAGSGATTGGSTIASDIAALIRALENGNSTAVNTAVATLGADLHTAHAGAASSGTGGSSSGNSNGGTSNGTGALEGNTATPPTPTEHHHSHHLDHIWHF